MSAQEAVKRLREAGPSEDVEAVCDALEHAYAYIGELLREVRLAFPPARPHGTRTEGLRRMVPGLSKGYR